MSESPSEATRLLVRIKNGDAAAQRELLPLVYGELLEIARERMAHCLGHTLQPTALVHEAWLKLMRGEASWDNRRHFLSAAARAMRHILADHARGRNTLKRGGERVPLEFLEGTQISYDSGTVDIVVLHEALDSLQALDAGLAELVELRFFGGLENHEVAQVLGVSTRTVERRWKLARGWLRQSLDT